MHCSSPIRGPRIAALLLLAAIAGGCRQQPGTAENVAREPVANQASVVRPSPPLDRAALLAAVAQAASSAASATPLPPELRQLDGRQFEVRIRFGCRGPSSGNGTEWLNWSYNAGTRTIRVSARPTISADESLVATIGGEGFEAAEGFWIPRPWLLQPVCPATAAVQTPAEQESEQAGTPPSREAGAKEDAEPLPARQRVGIAQFFTDSDSRTARRDSRPYQAVHTLEEGQAIGSQGFNLVLSGRLRALPGGGVIKCVAPEADTPPDCIVSAEFQRAWIEQPETGKVIADWGGG